MKKDAMKRLRSATLSEDLGFLFARSRAVWVARDNEAFATVGLRGRSYSVLALAVSGVNPTQRELADFLFLDASQIVALIDELEAMKLVERQTSPNDRRTNIIIATEKGKEVHQQARDAARKSEDEAHLSLSDEERSELIGLLQRVAF